MVLYRFFSVTLSIDEIQYVGIADFDDMNIGGLSIQGGATKYIYLSVKPYPSEYRHKVLKLRTKPGFIKFKYFDAVCLALMDVLPPEKQGQLRGFYEQMQLEEQHAEREAKQERRKLKREKELKKRKKKNRKM